MLEAGLRATSPTRWKPDPRRVRGSRTSCFALEVHPTEIAFDIASTAKRALAAVGGASRASASTSTPRTSPTRTWTTCGFLREFWGSECGTCTSRTSGGPTKPDAHRRPSAATRDFGVGWTRLGLPLAGARPGGLRGARSALPERDAGYRRAAHGGVGGPA